GQQAKYGLAAVELGAVGTVASMPNYWGRQFAEFFDACRTGDLIRARAFQTEKPSPAGKTSRGRRRKPSASPAASS
ncbi:MAG: hypothetical protein QGH70_03350, partial [Nitrospinota bacterium]|nr:hypothetical protein [Nitrospinota bacterium]